MRLLDTNVIALERAIAALLARGRPKLFSVSSDKAVRPASLMGASKRWMERILASHSGGGCGRVSAFRERRVLTRQPA